MKNIIKNAYIALLAGVAETYKGGIKSIDKYGKECFIHFPDFPDVKKVVAKKYYKSGVIQREEEWYNGIAHGKHTIYYPSGTKLSEGVWKNGGWAKYTRWDKNGVKQYEARMEAGGIMYEGNMSSLLG